MERIQVSNDEMVAGHGVEPQNPLPKAGLVWHRDVWYILVLLQWEVYSIYYLFTRSVMALANASLLPGRFITCGTRGEADATWEFCHGLLRTGKMSTVAQYWGDKS